MGFLPLKISIKARLTIIAVLFILTASAQKKKDLTPLVNPFIGTGGHGHTYPGAVVPFGMVQLSPDTRLTGWDGCSGYYYSDTTVYGFSHTHLSGTGIADYCDILFMPTTGEPLLLNNAYSSGFKKKNESASPGYYKTKLDKYNIGVELTATTRAGVHKYTYPATRQANIIVDLQHRDEVLDSWIEVVNDHEIRGFRKSKSWANEQYVYFYAKFSKPFRAYGIAADNVVRQGQQKVEGKNIKMFMQFDNPGEVIAKVGISAVSPEGALKNLDAEVPDFDFKKIQKNARALWNDALNKIQVESSSASSVQQPASGMPYGANSSYSSRRQQPAAKSATPVYAANKQVIFYTALYHTMLAPNIYNDADGQYRGLDQKIHHADGFDYYTVFSLWDTFRAEDPLFGIIDQKRTLDFIKTFLAMYEQGGLLPIWPLASNETFCMIGNHSIPVIVDAYAKGIKNFDAEEALKAMKAAVNRDQFGLDVYRKNGAVLADQEPESVSKTLEYAYDDWCIAQMAKMMGKTGDYDEFSKRAQYWKNVYNDQNGFMQARLNGGWYAPFDPTDINNNYTEGNSWQYSFLVPQDVNGLMERMGGQSKFEAKLDELFSTNAKLSGREQADVTGLIGQYAHGNEPSHHMAYLYNFTNSPEKTQFYINRILNEEYSDKPDGLAGNEDCGQMSAWYVLSALGIYTIAPGQTQYQIGLPQFEKATINLENGKKFVISNAGAGLGRDNIYLQGMNLNKSTYNKVNIEHAAIANGGELEIYTGKLTNKLYLQGIEKSVAQNTGPKILSNPYIIYPSVTFKEPVRIEIKCAEPDAQIYYTLDGSVPDRHSALYTGPIVLTNTTTVKAIAVKGDITSFVDEGTFTKVRGDLKITLLKKYLSNYPAQGTNSLIDGIKGTTNWRLGNWQGYQGNDLEAVIDLGSEKQIGNISLETLQDTRSWIVFPKYVQYLVSKDGIDYQLAATVNTKTPIDDTGVSIQQFNARLNLKTRYIKVIAKQYGPLPGWHESKGSESYIFADEIIID
jgi:putative alpha-1,2-mannosidase